MQRVLIIDDDADICTMLSRFLEKKGYSCAFALSGGQGLKTLAQDNYDVAIVDFRLPDTDGIQLLQRIKAHDPDIAVVIITGYSDIRTAVNSMKSGAVDYIVKPLQPDELLAVLSKLHTRDAKATPRPGSVDTMARPEPSEQFVQGKSREGTKLQSSLTVVAPTNLAVIIQGDTGTGKECVAREIHRTGGRRNFPFVAVDCAALTDVLAAAELFGQEKTDEEDEKDGSFKLAHAGTLFLDEIVSLSADMQTKLLRALQEKKIKRVGGTREIPIDVRVIAASNDDLRIAVKEGRFREDLFHRLNEFSLHLPSLRERKEDIPDLARYFLKLANYEFNKSVQGFDEDVTRIFNVYHWPGNLRELKNVIRRSVLLCPNKVLSEEFLPQEMVAEANLQGTNTNTTDLKYSATVAEKHAILDALAKTGNNKTEAAKLLNVDRKTLYNKLRMLNIKYKK